ncbi:MAG TPA: N-acetylmuramoyl-L-alanine amidase [Steroidobacteraceae bacterium]|nr:N-acetylmuramoyl-L-alanine amidase [Steroidobacteraceae bacterium]
MIKKAFQIGVVAALMAAVNLAWAAGTELRGVHVSATPTGTQVTLDLTSATSQRLFTLDHPQRAVIDLRNTRLGGNVRLPLGTGVVSGFRVGTQPGGTLRVVMQLRSLAPTRSVWLQTPGSSGRQLVVTLGDASAALPAAAPAPMEIDTTPKIIRAAHAPVDSGRDVVVAVDAGHGGQDPGAIGHGGTREKDVVLAIARALAERINGEPGMRAVLTRDRDEFLVLRDRIGRARLAKADMFVSIHADSIANRDVSGASVYVLSEHGASNEAARWLADRENAADLMGGVKLDDKDKQLASVLLDLSQTANISASMTAAQRVIGSLDAVGQVRKAQVQQAGFVVLKSPDIPSMLVETAYISNPEEEVSLRNTRHQAALADAVFAGLRGYFQANPPVGTRYAQAHRATVASVLAAPAP